MQSFSYALPRMFLVCSEGWETFLSLHLVWIVLLSLNIQILLFTKKANRRAYIAPSANLLFVSKEWTNTKYFSTNTVNLAMYHRDLFCSMIYRMLVRKAEQLCLSVPWMKNGKTFNYKFIVLYQQSFQVIKRGISQPTTKEKSIAPSAL